MRFTTDGNADRSRVFRGFTEDVVKGNFCEIGWRNSQKARLCKGFQGLPTGFYNKKKGCDRLSDFEQKNKYMLYARPETIAKAESMYKIEGSKSRSEFIEHAINFYSGYINSNNSLDYFPEVIVSSVQGTLGMFENRISSLLFKNAVELAMMMHITAANFRIDQDTLSRLRGKCVNDVKRLNGRIDFEDAVKYQKGDD